MESHRPPGGNRIAVRLDEGDRRDGAKGADELLEEGWLNERSPLFQAAHVGRRDAELFGQLGLREPCRFSRNAYEIAPVFHGRQSSEDFLQIVHVWA